MRKGLTVAFVIVAFASIMSAQSPIAIGLVREDGHLIPITLVGPELFEERLVIESTTVDGEPIPLDRPPLPFKDLAWTLTEVSRKTTTLRTLAAITADSHCETQDVWTTTLRRPPIKEHEAPNQKIGIAVAGIAVEFPEDVADQPDAQSRRVARRIVALFQAKEKARLTENLGPSSYLRDWQGLPVRLRVLMRHVVAGVATHYFEATKSPEHSNGIVADGGLLTGWIVDSPAGLIEHEVVYKINDDSYKENDRAYVRGIVPYRGHALWLLEWHGYEWEYYTIHDWPSGLVRVNLSGGGC